MNVGFITENGKCSSTDYNKVSNIYTYFMKSNLKCQIHN